jgi:hypothetical protein
MGTGNLLEACPLTINHSRGEVLSHLDIVLRVVCFAISTFTLLLLKWKTPIDPLSASRPLATAATDSCPTCANPLSLGVRPVLLAFRPSAEPPPPNTLFNLLWPSRKSDSIPLLAIQAANEGCVTDSAQFDKSKHVLRRLVCHRYLVTRTLASVALGERSLSATPFVLRIKINHFCGDVP